ncbi:TRL-like family protein [Rickettsiales bacterium]|nr:TRL-like family protein [Rickettsiales bacterium]
MLKNIFLLLSILFLFSCHSYSTKLNEMETLNMSEVNEIRQGLACSHNLFGAFSLPYFGDTAIRLSGNESVINALKNGNIQNVYVIDKSTKNYIFYSKRCTIVFGH